MNEWRTPIRCYVSPAGNNLVADWYEGLSVQAQSDAYEFLKNMRKTREWKMPDYRPRLGGNPGLGELRWRSENKQYRILGFFKDGCWQALVGCIHKGQAYNPREALETAKRYKRQVEQGGAVTVEYDF